MASPRERDYRGGAAQQAASRPALMPSQSVHPAYHRHHFHDVPPWPHQRYHDYSYFEGWGWWPRWFPYWDQRWHDYWWYLYDYYGGDAYADYAEYMRDAVIRQYAPQWGLTISGAWMGADPRSLVPAHGALSPNFHLTHGGSPPRQRDYDDRYRQRDYDDRYRQHDYDDRYRRQYPHPHDHYGDYVVVDSAWWPRWYPYWDPAWVRYWWQLYYAYGGDAQSDYAQYARDAYLRSLARQWGWI